MRGVQVLHADAPRIGNKRRAVRFVMRSVMVPLMLGFGTYTVATDGLQGLVPLLPILVAHVVGFLVIYPLWILHRRRRAGA